MGSKVQDQSRKIGGVYYTPEFVVRSMVEQAIGPLLADRSYQDFQKTPLTILEPACGAGAFLLGTYRFLLNRWGRDSLSLRDRQRILLNCLYGVDIDAEAIEQAKHHLVRELLLGEPTTSDLNAFAERTYLQLAQNLKCGNTLFGNAFTATAHSLPSTLSPFHWPDQFPSINTQGGFDAVIGNPPYLDSEWMSLHLPDWRKYCAIQYETATGNWDLFCVFIERSLDLCKSGGITSLIVPNKLGSAGYAAPARHLLTRHHLLAIRDYSRIPVFPVAVYPIVYRVCKVPPPPDKTLCYEQVHAVVNGVEQVTTSFLEIPNSPQPWPIFARTFASSLIDRLRLLPTLGEIAQVKGAATVAEAYQLQPLIQEGFPALSDLKFVNSGTIDRYHIRWGKKNCRYLGQVYQYPHLPVDSLGCLSAKRRQQATQPKLILAGMTRYLECVLDCDGTLLAGKSTTLITASLNLFYLLALLNSKLLSFFYQSLYGGDRLQGGYLRIGPPQVRTLPIVIPDSNNPEIKQAHDALITLAQQRSEEGIDPLIALDLEEQMDGWVYQLYRVSDREIAAIEGRFN